MLKSRPGGYGAWERKSGWQRSARAGRVDVRAGILSVLRDGARNGYQITLDIAERSGGAWRPSPGAVYPALSQLADEGLIESEKSEGRRVYRLTEAGLDYIEQHPENARGAFESAPQRDAWQPSDLVAEAARLGRGIAQVAQVAAPQQLRSAEELLEKTRRGLYKILAGENGAGHE